MECPLTAVTLKEILWKIFMLDYYGKIIESMIIVNILMKIIILLCMCGQMHAIALIGKSEDNLQELTLSFTQLGPRAHEP